VSFNIHCIDRPKASNESLLISDEQGVSTTELLRKVSNTLDKKSWLIPQPASLVICFAKLIGKGDVSAILLGSLQIDSSKARGLLDYKSVITMDQQLKKSADAYLNMKRIFDLLLALTATGLLILPILVTAVLVKLTSKGPALYWSDRVGRDNKIFKMPKFRSMKVDTPAVATHLLSDPESVLTPVGGFLRKSSLDELPQVWSILNGDMSFVGPRPALFNQDDLIALRTEHNVHTLVPGLTGWAQVNGRDELQIPKKVSLDVEYLKHQSIVLDIKIIWLTFVKVIKKDGVSH